MWIGTDTIFRCYFHSSSHLFIFVSHFFYTHQSRYPTSGLYPKAKSVSPSRACRNSSDNPKIPTSKNTPRSTPEIATMTTKSQHFLGTQSPQTPAGWLYKHLA